MSYPEDRHAPGRGAVPTARAPWIALVGPEEEENLGLRYLAGALSEAGFHAEIIPYNIAAELPRVLESIPADSPPLVVAISLAFQRRARDGLALALALRERGYAGHITAGGHFGTFACRELLADFPELDSICLYEAEDTLVQLARALVGAGPRDRIAGLACRKPGGRIVLTPVAQQARLDELPWPDRRGVPMSVLGHVSVPIVASRGCYANCAFCCIAAWHGEHSGERFRLRPVNDVADEMAWLYRERRAEIFVFHDDNFFLPRPAESLHRIHALADALAARGVGGVVTAVKARPNDVTPDVFRTLRDRLGCTRLYLGIESATEQGLRTLRRGVRPERIEAALRTVGELGLYCGFNMLIFDPDTTIESLKANLAFMEAHADVPWNFCRVELYAGTPLLARMQREGRCRGDYLGWDYALGDQQVQRVFELTMRCFFPRNFAPDALANRLQGTRFDVEICRHFHPIVYRPQWRAEGREMSRHLRRGPHRLSDWRSRCWDNGE